MIDILLGERIGQACRDTWNKDGLTGRLNATAVTLGMTLLWVHGVVSIIKAII
jgi:hypothetical protein